MGKAKKCKVHCLSRHSEMSPKITDDWALEIQDHPNHQLKVSYGCCPVPYRIIGDRKLGIRHIASVCPVHSKEQAGQDKPSGKIVQESKGLEHRRLIKQMQR